MYRKYIIHKLKNIFTLINIIIFFYIFTVIEEVKKTTLLNLFLFKEIVLQMRVLRIINKIN